MIRKVAIVTKHIEDRQITQWKVIHPEIIDPQFQELPCVTNWIVTNPTGVTLMASRPLTGTRKLTLRRQTIESMVAAMNGMVLDQENNIILDKEHLLNGNSGELKHTIGQMRLLRGGMDLDIEPALNQEIFHSHPHYPIRIWTDLEHATRFWVKDFNNWKCKFGDKAGKNRYNTEIKFLPDGCFASGGSVEEAINVHIEDNIIPKIIILMGFCMSYEAVIRIAKKCQKYNIKLHAIYNVGMIKMPYEGTDKRTDLPPNEMVTKDGILRKLYRRYQIDTLPRNTPCLIGDESHTIDPNIDIQAKSVLNWIDLAANRYRLDMKKEAQYLHTYDAGVLTKLHQSNSIREINSNFSQSVEEYLRTLNLIK